MMGIYRNDDPRNLVLPAGQPLSLLDLENFARRNQGALLKPNRYLGTWAPEHGTYLDVSQRFDPDAIRTATKFGERTAQEKGYNVGTGQEFPVGNWMNFIQGPEYRQRLREVAEQGHEYMRKYPSAEWWDMYGSPFERVYGRENLPWVAGYTARASAGSRAEGTSAAAAPSSPFAATRAPRATRAPGVMMPAAFRSSMSVCSSGVIWPETAR
jgi:hypothetical protein